GVDVPSTVLYRSGGTAHLVEGPAEPAAQGAGATHGAESPTVEYMWREYETPRSRAARDRLILHYSPVVKFVAKRAQGRMPNGVEDAELVSWGVFGLIDAIEKFDRSRGVDFEKYAPRRIAGAITDELRSFDWVPRSVRRKTAALERAAARLQGEL